MLIEQNIQKILTQLAKGQSIKIPYRGTNITIRVIDEASKLSLNTPVYQGSNYIPNSVRICVSRPTPFFSSIRSFLTIDEQNFQINLNYLGNNQAISHDDFKEILEDFRILAEKWQNYLDEHDKNDLVYAKFKS